MAPPSRESDETLASFLREHLFDLVPSAIAVIDREFNLVDANEQFEELFGEWRGRRCYEVYKGQKRRCGRCPALRAFAGSQHTHTEVGVDRHGRPAYYVVQASPVMRADGTVPYVIEMSTDVTRQHILADELSRAHLLTKAVFEGTGNAVVVLNPRGRVTLWNASATSLFGWTADETMGHSPPAGLLPPCHAGLGKEQPSCSVAEFAAPTKTNGAVPVGFFGVRLSAAEAHIGTAAIFHDLREVKQLEREKLDAERFAAVGQTVAGLAHGVKNILTGLEGGLYFMRSGLDRGNSQRLREGFDMLSRNLGRVTTFVRALLAFSRGNAPAAKLVDPVALADESLALFRDAATREGIDLRLDVHGSLEPAAFDPEAMHTCLSNLVTNAIDACRTSDKAERHVTLRVFEQPDTYPYRLPPVHPPTAVVFEVSDDGVGMDYEVKQKVFTTFFTTKGEGGTGLGLLLTRKIVHEHGGTVAIDSEPGKGTTFRLVFARRRLPRISEEPRAS
jgi:PAS domain S-box-containing protein